MIDVDLDELWPSMKYELAQIVRQGGGPIVNVAPIAGLIGIRVNTVGIASKHGVTGRSRAVAIETTDQGLRLDAICPGWVETVMTDSATSSLRSFRMPPDSSPAWRSRSAVASARRRRCRRPPGEAGR